METELERELPPGHVLGGTSIRAVAARFDRDDVLFALPGGEYAVVHLTWSRRRESDARWPSTEVFSSIQDWRERRMQPDYEDYARH